MSLAFYYGALALFLIGIWSLALWSALRDTKPKRTPEEIAAIRHWDRFGPCTGNCWGECFDPPTDIGACAAVAMGQSSEAVTESLRQCRKLADDVHIDANGQPTGKSYYPWRVAPDEKVKTNYEGRGEDHGC